MTEPTEPGGDVPEERRENPHNPEGLDVARQIADAIRHAPEPGVQLPPPKVKRSARRPRATPTNTSTPFVDPERDPKPLGAAIEDLVDARGWSKEVTLQTLLGRWPALVGPSNADHSRPEAFRDGVLTVRADSTAWATNLRQFAPRIVAILNDKLGDGSVTRIVILGPDVPSWKHGRRSVRDGRGPRDTYG